MRELLGCFVKLILASLASASIGALIVTFLIDFWPGSTAPLAFSTWLSIFLLSLIVVLVVGSMAISLGQPIIRLLPKKRMLTLVAGLFGGFLYFMINLTIAALMDRDEAQALFFSSGAYIIPIGVGFVFGSLFGFFYRVGGS